MEPEGLLMATPQSKAQVCQVELYRGLDSAIVLPQKSDELTKGGNQARRTSSAIMALSEPLCITIREVSPA